VPLHPQAKAFLDLMAMSDLPDISIQGAYMSRKHSHDEPEFSGPVEDGIIIHHRYFTSPTADLPVSIYMPEDSSGPFNGMVYFHGGGWVRNCIARYEAQLVSLAKKTNSVILAVNYQKSPEHKFPIPFDDCFSALEWFVANAKNWNVDPGRIGVGGDSAGGNLASGVSLKARDTHSIDIAYQLLIYPCNNLEFDSPSMVANANGYGLTRKAMIWLWEQYLNGGAEEDNPYAVPHRAKDYSSLPPTILITAEYDVLRDDGRLYAQKLQEAGVPVTYRDFPGLIHGFFNYGKYIDEGIAVRDYFADEINRILRCSERVDH
jgi:acetyl esterase